MATRKFFCDNNDCKRRIFTEPIPTVAARYKRKTRRLMEALQSLTLLAGGEVAARIAQAFGLTLSPDTLLEAIQKAPAQPLPTPRVLGVDDFAFKRGRRYGTLLVDMERRCPIDLLPERSSAALTEWLKAGYPLGAGVEIVTRDRSTEFAKGITDGAPQAIQVANRFHLLSNLREALERSVDRNRSQLKGIELPTQGSESAVRPRVPYCGSQAERQGKFVRQECRSRQHQEIHALKERGTPILTISRQLGISRSTVYHYLRVEEDGVRCRSHRSSSILDPFVAYLSERFEGGCHNGVQLWQEIKKMGYPGQD
jgi:transposase